MLGQERREPRVRLLQPAAHSDAVRHARESVRVELGEVTEDRLLHQLRMQPRHTVDGVAADDGEVGHPHQAAVIFLDERHAAAPLVVVRVARGDFVEQRAVDQVDDLQMPRQQPLEERHGPGLERLGQQGVVCVREHAPRDRPGRLPLELVLVDEQPHQLGDRERRVRVVELDRHGVRQCLERSSVGQVLGQDVLQACADEEVRLLEPQLLALRRRVVGTGGARRSWRPPARQRRRRGARR